MRVNQYFYDHLKNVELKLLQNCETLVILARLLHIEALGPECEMELGKAAPSEQRQRTNRLPVILNSDQIQALTHPTHTHTNCKMSMAYSSGPPI